MSQTCSALTFIFYFKTYSRINLSIFLKLCGVNIFVKSVRVCPFEHKINQSSTKVSTRRVTSLYSDDICYNVVVVFKCIQHQNYHSMLHFIHLGLFWYDFCILKLVKGRDSMKNSVQLWSLLRLLTHFSTAYHGICHLNLSFNFLLFE